MSVDPSTNPQIDHSDSANLQINHSDSANLQIDHSDSTNLEQPDQKKMDHLADDMAGKASRVQSKNESTINTGSSVSSGGGGLFSK